METWNGVLGFMYQIRTDLEKYSLTEEMALIHGFEGYANVEWRDRIHVAD